MVFILSITEYFKDMSTSAKKILKLFVDWMQNDDEWEQWPARIFLGHCLFKRKKWDLSALYNLTEKWSSCVPKVVSFIFHPSF